MTNRTNYIEFRVYLRDELSNVDRTNVLVLADQMQDMLADFVSESNECRPEVFTEDVTYDTNLGEPKYTCHTLGCNNPVVNQDAICDSCFHDLHEKPTTHAERMPDLGEN